MDYEKKYKEALKKAEAFYYSATTEPITEREVLANIFPELKESEDERIRKEIIAFIKKRDRSGCDYDYDKWIAWLEKQGETITEDFGEFINTLSKQFTEVSFAKLSRIAVRVKRWIEKQGEKKETACDRCKKAQPNGSCQDITALGRCYIEGERKVKDTTVIYHESGLKALEKSLEKGCTDGEQKLNDKVEPKFKVGDWIISDETHEDYRICKITNVENGNYTIESIYGYKGYNTFETFEKSYHLWSIEDAKDGDVLVTDDMIVLFKKRLENDSILTYFHYDTIDGEYEPGAHLYYAHIYPATKEQCDLLFQKMKEAGYEYDAEKKELKKIHVIDEGKGFSDD